MSKTLTNEQYQATLRDPVAFHKHILSGNRKKVMSAIGTFMG